MKILKKSVFIISTVFFITSCNTTKIGNSEFNDQSSETESIITENLPPTEEELFIESLNNVKIEFTQTPKTANYGKKFSSTFKVFVSDSEKKPLKNYSLTFKYPCERSDSLKYEQFVIETNDEGFAEYEQKPLSFGVKDYVTVYPTPKFEDDKVIEACLKKSVKAQIKVKSNIMTKGALLYVWDMNEKNKPVNNSYELLSVLRNSGCTLAGNAPINDTAYINSPIEKIYKLNYEIVNDSYGYLICGTIKFVEPVTKVDDNYKCSLIAEITTVNMKSGKIQMEKKYTHDALGANWNKATTKCKEELADMICEDIIYGL